MNIEYSNITINRDNKKIIDNFSLTIDQSKICVIVGPSGSGKSTLLEATAGLIPIESGQLYFNQIDITNTKPSHRQIGYVFQDFALYPNMTVFQNIEFGLKVQKIPKQQRIERTNQVLKTVELIDFANALPANLSGGQKQRVAIARALVLEPKVLLMDEPLSSLDAHLRQLLRNQITTIQKHYNNTIIFVTHDQSEALAIADHIIVLDHGKIIAQGCPFELYNNPPNEQILKFFNSEHLNIIDQPSFISKAIGSTLDKIFIRPADIDLEHGNDFIITQVILHGETQLLVLKGAVTLNVSVSSAIHFTIGQRFNLTIKNYFSFQ